MQRQEATGSAKVVQSGKETGSPAGLVCGRGRARKKTGPRSQRAKKILPGGQGEVAGGHTSRVEDELELVQTAGTASEASASCPAAAMAA